MEEIGKVEQEIALLQHELEDAKKLNDELSKKIDRKVRCRYVVRLSMLSQLPVAATESCCTDKESAGNFVLSL